MTKAGWIIAGTFCVIVLWALAQQVSPAQHAYTYAPPPRAHLQCTTESTYCYDQRFCTPQYITTCN
jgi:hypothetical protein